MRLSAYSIKALSVGLLLATSWATQSPAQPAAATSVERVLPSAADPGVHDGDDANLVYGDGLDRRRAPMVVFLPGTNGTSERAPDLFLRTVADQGYRVIGYRVIFLSYDDDLAGSRLCPRAPEGCYARFRDERLYGGSEPPAPTPAPEAIVPRLVALLRYLDHEHPGAGGRNRAQSFPRQHHPPRAVCAAVARAVRSGYGPVRCK